MKYLAAIALLGFILLAIYSLDYASDGYTLSQIKAKNAALDRGIIESEYGYRQAMLIRELYDE